MCLLGLGRSGTSLAARAVNLLGVDLGAEETMLPSDDLNPQGYWEQRQVVELNDEILAALGGTWWRPPSRRPGWEAMPELEPFRRRIEDLVAGFGERRWGFKDPRTTLTLPLWRSVVGDFDHVVCLRDPLEVAASAGDRMPAGADVMALWLHYGCEALRLTAGRRRLFVFYDDWSADPRRVAADLAEFVNGVVDDEAVERVASAFDPGLRRQRVGDRELDDRRDVPVGASMFLRLARELAAVEARGETTGARTLQELASCLDEAAIAGGPSR